MEKILSWLNDFKSFFSSEVSKISNAQAELAKVSAELATANGTITGLNEKLGTMSAELETAKATATSAVDKIKAAEDKAAAAEKSAQELLATQGLTQDQLPAGGEPKNGGKSAASTYRKLVSEGKNQEAARFFAANSDEIFKSL